MAQTFLQKCDAAVQMEKVFDDEELVQQQSNSTIQTHNQTELIEMTDKIVQSKIQQNDADVQTEQEAPKTAEQTTIDVHVQIQTEYLQTQNKDAATQSEFDVPATDQVSGWKIID